MPDGTAVAVVTGAGSGMGRACVDVVRAVADVVVVADLREPDLPDTVGVACDVSEVDSVHALAARVAELGELRALVHAAGISPTMGDGRRVLDVDLVGTELVLRAFERLVVPGAAAVCFASSAAHQVAPFVTDEQIGALADPLAVDLHERLGESAADSGFAYALAKVGVLHAVRRAAVRWGPLGGRVTSVSPGLIDTPMGRQELAAQPVMQQMLASTPIGRLGEAREVAAAVGFLVSDAASFVSGVDVLVDGGMVHAMSGAAAAPPPRS